VVPPLLDPLLERLLLIAGLPEHRFLGLVRCFLCFFGDLLGLLLGNLQELLCRCSRFLSDLTQCVIVIVFLG
jgi:hypothetical protein